LSLVIVLVIFFWNFLESETFCLSFFLHFSNFSKHETFLHISWMFSKRYFCKNVYPIFRTTMFLTFQAQSLFKQATVSLFFLPCNISHSKQAAVVFIPTFNFLAVSVLPFPSERCKRVTPSEWVRYSLASTVMKVYKHREPVYLYMSLNETLFTVRRKPSKWHFYDNGKGKIGRQKICTKLKFFDNLSLDWIAMDFLNSRLRRTLKKAIFSYLDDSRTSMRT